MGGNRTLLAAIVTLVTIVGGLNLVGAFVVTDHAGVSVVGGGVPAAVSPSGAASAATAPSLASGTNFQTPSGARTSLLSSLPSSLSRTPWLEALEHPSSSVKPLVSLPNLNLLVHPAKSVAGSISPGYTAQPAPLGLADFGLGVHTYSYNTSHVLGEVTFSAAPNVTDPGATGVIEPAAGGAHQGAVGSPNEFGIQLNTVATNISIPGSDQGFFWTQNVVNWNDTGIHFVSDTFNVSAGSGFYLAPGTIYSGCNNGTAGVDQILYVYGGVFQCVGATIPVTPASYPVTLQLYNNATVNAQNRTVVSYGYYIFEAGTDQTFTGVSDAVVFNNPTAAISPPANRPGFCVNGFEPAPAGLLCDSEIDFVGSIGGDNSVFRSISGTVNLQISNQSSGGFTNVPSAYNFGGDTGETSTGIADYWTAGHSLVINQGPAILYGLWNTPSRVAVASGSIHLEGSITPSYGFVFLSNTPPVSDLLVPGARDNMSWVPTNNSGGFNTYLPPLGAPWTTQYYVQGLASGSAEVNGTPVTGTDTNYALTLPLDHGNLRAPLYMFSAQQASELAANVSGSAGPPYSFANLNISVNTTFTHLNDYDYPSFELVMAQGVGNVQISNVTEGNNSPVGALYSYDGASAFGPPLSTPPAVFDLLPFYTSQINLYGGLLDTVSDESLIGYAGQGGEIVLWHDQGATITSIADSYGSQGIWVGKSINTVITGVSDFDATAVQDIASVGTHGVGIAVEFGVAVDAYSSAYDRFSDVSVYGGEGIVDGADYGFGVSPYYNLPGTNGLTVTGLSVTGGSLGANISLSEDTDFTTITADSAYSLVWLDGATGATISDATGSVEYAGFYLYDSSGVALSDGDLTGGSYGVAVFDSLGVNSVSHFELTDGYAAIYVLFSGNLTVRGVTAVDDVWGVLSTGSSDDTVTGSLFLGNAAYGVLVEGGSGTVVYDNSFVNNNGAGYSYSASHVQAYTTVGNVFHLAKVGNYWSDWHEYYANGSLKPYPISNGVVDPFPLGSGPGVYTVTFSETGLAAGKLWSVALAGEVVNTTNTTVVIPEVNGSYAYLVRGPAGERVSGIAPAGTIVVAGADLTESVHLAKGKTFSITIARTGLPKGTKWCATIGFTSCTTTGSIALKDLSPGTYSYAIAPIAGYTESVKLKGVAVGTSGPVTLTTGSAKLALKFTQVTYALTFSETGLITGTKWTVKVTGDIGGKLKTLKGSSTTSTIVFEVPNGTYLYDVEPVKGYSGSGIGTAYVEDGPSTYDIGFTTDAIGSSLSSPAAFGLSAGRN